jgi:molybdate transport system regulatory protein
MRQVIQICGGIFCTMKKETGKITSTYGETRLGASVQVRLAKEDIFFGPGKARLMEYIEKTGSIQEACLEMGLSYSKGARMIKMAEKQLGFRLLERRVGGSGGGGSRLTDEGRDLLKKYRQLTLRVQQDADRAFAEIFGNTV